MPDDVTSDHGWLYDERNRPAAVIVDASAVLAIVLREADRERYVDAILAATSARMSDCQLVGGHHGRGPQRHPNGDQPVRGFYP